MQDGIHGGENLGETRRRPRIDERRTPAVGADDVDQFDFRLRLHARPKHAARGTGSLPANVVERGMGRAYLQHMCRGQRVVVRDLAILVLGDLCDRDAEAEQTSVDGIESFGHNRVVEEVAVEDGAQLWIGVGERPAHDGAHFLDYWRGQTSGENRAARGT